MPDNAVELPDPDSISDDDLTPKLWEVLSGLAERHIYLEDTDRLSDRELYAMLYHDAHRQHPEVRSGKREERSRGSLLASLFRLLTSLSHHSIRNATTGSMRVARRAGNQDANSATRSSIADTAI